MFLVLFWNVERVLSYYSQQPRLSVHPYFVVCVVVVRLRLGLLLFLIVIKFNARRAQRFSPTNQPS